MWTQNDIKINHKKWNISEVFFCIEPKLCTVVPLVTKFHAMSTATFPWQHNGLHTLSIQREKSEFLFIKKCYLFLLFIAWVSLNMDITIKAQAKDSLLYSGPTIKAFFILGK